MSELKAVHAFDVYEAYTKTGDDDAAKVYLKSEADKVIAEKDKEIQRLENLCESYRIDCDNLAIHEANAYKEIERADNKLRHQKYKLCLSMARVCEERYNYLNCLENYQMTDKEYQQVIGDYWDRWYKRWLELAEKFKEGDKCRG